MKFFRQHGGALSCYLILVLWIFLILAGTYRFMNREPAVQVVAPERARPEVTGGGTERVRRFCNDDDFMDGTEGRVGGEFVLLGAALVFRHGMRGPLVHLRNTSALRCPGAPEPPAEPATHAPGFTQMLGPFHSLPLAPIECAGLGQLTPRGAEQLRRLGLALKHVYADQLALTAGEGGIAVFSTRYRRTFQSAIALLHGLLDPAPLPKHVRPFQEASSVFFCFADCACAAAERLRKGIDVEVGAALRAHPAVSRLAVAAAPFDGTDASPRSVLDALLVTTCHGADGGAAAAPLATYLEWEARRLAPRFRPLALLRSHPLLRNLGAQLLRFVAAPPTTPRLVLYAGHDRTIRYLGAALGLGALADVALPPFAGRLGLELYRRGAGGADSLFFRLLLNGRDLTASLGFCKSGLVHYDGLWGPEGARVPVTADLCPLESIVRFLHDDYFAPFNATNAKDACSMHF